MPNTSGNATTTTILTPILPGREADLQASLLRIPSGEAGPFMRLGNTHFARFVIIDGLEYEAAPQKRDTLKSHYLLFNALFDGPRDAFIEAMLEQLPDLADEIWGHCVAYPGSDRPQSAGDYFRHNELEATFFFAAYSHATLPQVRRALALREQVTRFAIAAQGRELGELRRRFREEFRRGEGAA
jgi:hypothetical protein